MGTSQMFLDELNIFFMFLEVICFSFAYHGCFLWECSEEFGVFCVYGVEVLWVDGLNEFFEVVAADVS